MSLLGTNSWDKDSAKVDTNKIKSDLFCALEVVFSYVKERGKMKKKGKRTSFNLLGEGVQI
mgnify:FL=1